MKRLFIAFLCIVMVMAFLPTVAFAQTNYFAVTIDGVRTEYPSAGDAVAAVGEGQTAVIELLADYNGGGVKIEPADAGKDITFKLNGHTWNVGDPLVGSPGTETNAFQLLKGNKVTFTDGAITSTKAKILFQNYCDLTIDKMDISLTTPGTGTYVASNNNGTTVIKGGTVITNTPGNHALDSFTFGDYEGGNVIVENATINGDVEAANGGKLTLNGGTINGNVDVYNYTYDNNVSKPAVFVMENGAIAGDLNTTKIGDTTINGGMVEGKVTFDDSEGAKAVINGGYFTSVDEKVEIIADVVTEMTDGVDTFIVASEDSLNDILDEINRMVEEGEIEAADLEQMSITVNKAPASFKLEVPVGVTVANATENPITVNDESVAADGEITVKEPETTNPDEGKDDPAVGGDDKPATEPEEKPETDKDVPKTGDSSNLVLWLTLLALTGSALAGTVVYSRKK